MATHSSTLAWKIPWMFNIGCFFCLNNGGYYMILIFSKSMDRVATREESGVLGFPSRRGLTPGGAWNVKVSLLSRVRLFATPWTVAFQAPPSMGFSRQWVAIAFS